jgi:hypothetical protein
VFVSSGWCKVEVPATVLSIVRMSPTECGVSGCNREASTMRGPWSSRAFGPWGRGGNRRGCNNFRDSPIPVALPLYCCDRGFESR